MDYSQIPLEGFGPKDKKIIKDNPGKTLQELAALGLTGKAYNRLEELAHGYEDQLNKKEKQSEPRFEMKDDVTIYEASEPIIKPVTVKTTIVQAQPATRLTGNNTGATSVWLYNNSTQNRVYMSRTAAEKLVKRNPTNFKIIG